MIVYTLHVGTYEDTTLVGMFTTIDLALVELARRALTGDKVEAASIGVEGVDGVEVTEQVRNDLDDRLRALGVFGGSGY